MHVLHEHVETLTNCFVGPNVGAWVSVLVAGQDCPRGASDPHRHGECDSCFRSIPLCVHMCVHVCVGVSVRACVCE